MTEGYYGHYVRTQATLPAMPEPARDVYTQLLALAGAAGHGYLNDATTQEARVENWFDPQAHAVVIFTFDNHSDRTNASDEACALKRVLYDNDYDYKSDKDTTNDSCVSPGEGIERATMFLSNAGDGDEAPTLRALIQYMKSQAGVYFSDMGQAATLFAQHYPSP